MRYFLVVSSIGGRKQVEGHAQPFPAIQELGMVPVHDFLRFHTFLVRPNGNWSAVSVAAGHHQYVIALHPVIPGKDVRREVTASHVAQVQRPVRIGPGNADEDTFGQEGFLVNYLEILSGHACGN